jgi:hypothetical protein
MLMSLTTNCIFAHANTTKDVRAFCMYTLTLCLPQTPTSVICTGHPPSQPPLIPAPTYLHYSTASPYCTTTPLSSPWHTPHLAPLQSHQPDNSPDTFRNKCTSSCRYRISLCGASRPRAPLLRWLSLRLGRWLRRACRRCSVLRRRDTGGGRARRGIGGRWGLFRRGSRLCICSSTC